MEQEELTQRLKEMAEYDGLNCSFYPDIEPNHLAVFKNDMWTEPKYHTSFDWSVPVWAKVYEEVRSMQTDSRISLAKTTGTAYFTIIDCNHLKFFLNLSDLIREVEKVKQSKTE